MLGHVKPAITAARECKEGRIKLRIKGEGDEELFFIQVLRNSDVFKSKWREIMAAFSCMEL
jgi:hypothetical protein